MNMMQKAIFNLLSTAKNPVDTTGLQVVDLITFMSKLGYNSTNNVSDFSRGALQIKNKHLPLNLTFNECIAIYNKSYGLQPSLELPTISYFQSSNCYAYEVLGLDEVVRKISDIYAQRLFVYISLCKNKKKKEMKVNNKYVRVNNESQRHAYLMVDIEGYGLIESHKLIGCDQILSFTSLPE